MMTVDQRAALLSARVTLARRPLGRGILSAQTAWRRWSWRWSRRAYPILKRTVDITGSLFVLIMLAPVMLLVALLVKLEDGGPSILVQTRVGKHGTRFRMFKFRSMAVNSDARVGEFFAKNKHARGITFKIHNDPRLTKVGKWIRKFSLDELPQLVNVLLGSMSLVGPRPPLPFEVAKYELPDRRRLEVTPGLTCFWQIIGRSDIDFPDQVRLDVLYIETRGFWTDLKILLKTPFAVLSCRGAY